MSRTSVLRGPCKVTINSDIFYSKGDITVKHVLNTFPVTTSRFGKVDERVDSVMDVIEFELDGRWVSGSLPTLFPYSGTVIGSSAFGADNPLTINTVDGYQRVYKAAAITKMPQLRMGRKLSLLGSVQFTCLYGGATLPSDTGSLYTDSAVSYPGDTGFSVADIIMQPYSLAWGAAPFDAFSSLDGVTIDFKLDLKQEMTETLGIYDFIFQGLEVSAKLRPDGPTIEDVLTALKHQGSGATLGRSLSASGNDLVISGTGVHVIVYNAGLKGFTENNSAMNRRMGEVEFTATRTITAGALDPLFRVGTAAP